MAICQPSSNERESVAETAFVFLEISMTWSVRKTERPAHDKKKERNME
jgi:hypothetical protein